MSDRQNEHAVSEVFPYLCVKDGAAAIEFYQRAFGARERFRLVEPGGRLGHTELELGGTVLMLSEEYPEAGAFAPEPADAAPFVIHLHVDSADAVAGRAIAAGATMIREPQDQFYGERSCRIRDPFGHHWLLGHQIDALSPEQMQARFTALV